MKNLILMRHAKALQIDSFTSDRNRHLSRRGVRDSKRVGAQLSKKKIIINMLVSSPAARAIETAQIIKKKLSKKIRSWDVDERIYMSGIDALKSVIIQASSKKKTLMLIGHNPEMDALINLVIPEGRHLKTSEVISLRLNAKRWADIFNAKVIKIKYLKK